MEILCQTRTVNSTTDSNSGGVATNDSDDLKRRWRSDNDLILNSGGVATTTDTNSGGVATTTDTNSGGVATTTDTNSGGVATTTDTN